MLRLTTRFANRNGSCCQTKYRYVSTLSTPGCAPSLTHTQHLYHQAWPNTRKRESAAFWWAIGNKHATLSLSISQDYVKQRSTDRSSAASLMQSNAIGCTVWWGGGSGMLMCTRVCCRLSSAPHTRGNNLHFSSANPLGAQQKKREAKRRSTLLNGTALQCGCWLSTPFAQINKRLSRCGLTANGKIQHEKHRSMKWRKA